MLKISYIATYLPFYFYFSQFYEAEHEINTNLRESYNSLFKNNFISKK